MSSQQTSTDSTLNTEVTTTQTVVPRRSRTNAACAHVCENSWTYAGVATVLTFLGVVGWLGAKFWRSRRAAAVAEPTN